MGRGVRWARPGGAPGVDGRLHAPVAGLIVFVDRLAHEQPEGECVRREGAPVLSRHVCPTHQEGQLLTMGGRVRRGLRRVCRFRSPYRDPHGGSQGVRFWEVRVGVHTGSSGRAMAPSGVLSPFWRLAGGRKTHCPSRPTRLLPRDGPSKAIRAIQRTRRYQISRPTQSPPKQRVLPRPRGSTPATQRATSLTFERTRPASKQMN